VQQHLVALTANLQLSAGLVDADPPAARAFLEEVARDVQLALDETGKLAHRVYPPLLEAGGLGAALRSAAMSTNVPTRIDVVVGAAYPPEIAGAVYFCCLGVLEGGAAGAPAVVTVRDEEGALTFEVVVEYAGPESELLRLRDRAEALDGRLTIHSESGSRTRVAGSIPFSE
jgi:signal transduction histidine kinase